MTRIIDAHITGVSRLVNSRNGNPRYKLFLLDREPIITKADGAIGYDVQNLSPGYDQLPVRVSLTIDGNNQACEVEEIVPHHRLCHCLECY